MSEETTRSKKTYLWHYKPETNELRQYETVSQLRQSEPDFRPGDGTRVFKGLELEFKTVEKVVIA